MKIHWTKEKKGHKEDKQKTLLDKSPDEKRGTRFAKRFEILKLHAKRNKFAEVVYNKLSGGEFKYGTLEKRH